jgi:hypothetical protein
MNIHQNNSKRNIHPGATDNKTKDIAATFAIHNDLLKVIGKYLQKKHLVNQISGDSFITECFQAESCLKLQAPFKTVSS